MGLLPSPQALSLGEPPRDPPVPAASRVSRVCAPQPVVPSGHARGLFAPLQNGPLGDSQRRLTGRRGLGFKPGTPATNQGRRDAARIFTGPGNKAVPGGSPVIGSALSPLLTPPVPQGLRGPLQAAPGGPRAAAAPRQCA